MEYAFSTAADVLAFVQFDNESDRADFNLRFHWIPVIGDDVFVVWNSGYTTDPGARFRFPESRAFDDKRPVRLNRAVGLPGVGLGCVPGGAR